jgi:hypothetical protein
MRARHAQYVTAEFDNGTLHAQADSQKRYFIFSGITNGGDLSFDSAVTKSRCNQNSMKLTEFFSYIFFINLLTVNPFNLYLGLIGYPGVNERFGNGFVGILEFNVLALPVQL